MRYQIFVDQAIQKKVQVGGSRDDLPAPAGMLMWVSVAGIHSPTMKYERALSNSCAASPVTRTDRIPVKTFLKCDVTDYSRLLLQMETHALSRELSTARSTKCIPLKPS